MNDYLQDIVNNLTGRSGLLDWLMQFAARDLIFLIVALPVVLWFWQAGARQRAANQRVAACCVLAGAVALAIARMAGMAHWEARPFVNDADTRLLIQHSADNSFPSDHVTLAFAIAAALVTLRPRLGWVALAGACAVGVGRVFVGVHWPDDIAAGMAIGLLAGVACASLESRWVRPQRALAKRLPAILVAEP